MADGAEVVRIKPQQYLHVLDNNTNVTNVVLGPKTFTRQDHEKVVFGPEQMVMVPTRNYCIISNPVARDEKGKPLQTKNGQYKLRHGDEEIRFEQEPFPLYPGEKLVGKVSPLQVVEQDRALRLKAIRDFTDAEGTLRKAGDEWLFKGPNTYIPLVEVQVVEIVKAVVLKANQALKLRAKKTTVDWQGIPRSTGEEWLVRTVGAYLVGVDEENVQTVSAVVLTDKKALSLRANRTFKDIFGVTRRAGAEWLVTLAEAETYIPDVHETIVQEVKITSLTNRQFCVVVDPVNEKGEQQFGKKELRIGEVSFFLRPGESLEGGIQNVFVLGEDEALLLKALEEIKDAEGKVTHRPGQLWMEKGPREYFPPVEVQVIEKRKTIPLDENEGIYVRDVNTGKVRAVSGSSYMLKPTEELWKKELPAVVEELLKKNSESGRERDKTRVVAYRVPHNSAVQLYDYKLRKSRIIFGPELAMLGPDESFSLLDLSGDTPKRPHVVKDIALRLGPDFMTDVVIVETADHARLSLKVNYNWHFEVDPANPKMFFVKDFVGDCCKALASRVRGAVSGVNFDSFHKSSASIIREAVFGRDPEGGKIHNKFTFTENGLVVTNLDIQTVEPVDQRTRESLQKSVQLAIEITTKAQEANAKHESSRKEQQAMGKLERQKIEDEAKAEASRKELLALQAESAAVEAKGIATAEAKAKAEALKIEGETLVDQAKLQTQALEITAKNELATTVARQQAEIEHQRAVAALEIDRAKKLAEIESKKFAQIVNAIGADTIQSIAEAGPAMQAKLLDGLGLQSFLITDGNSPINLFNTASGLVAPKQ